MLRQARTKSATNVCNVILCSVNMQCHPASGTVSSSAEATKVNPNEEILEVHFI